MRLDGRTAEHSKTKIKMRRRLYTSNYIGMAGYLMDFGFGGFIGYGKGVSGFECQRDRYCFTKKIEVAPKSASLLKS